MAELKTAVKAAKPAAAVADGKKRVELTVETYVPAEGGGHQKAIAGSVVDVPELDAAHLIAIGKAKAAA